VAALVEGKLGDLDRTLAVWRRMWELAPGYERAREAQKRILQKTKQWDQMVPLFVDEAERAEDTEQKIDVLHRLARLHSEKLANIDNAIAVYLQILAIDPREAVALRNVIETYEKNERWADLAPLLRSQIEIAPTEPRRSASCAACSSSTWRSSRISRGLLGRDPDPEVPSGRQRRLAAPGIHPRTVGRQGAPGEDAGIPPALRGVGQREAPHHQAHRRSVAE
jgi:tetratricopeptide (TPR) repeat protein